MKTLLFCLFTLALTLSVPAAPKPEGKPEASPAAKPAKPSGFNLEATEVTANGFTHVLKSGVKETMTVTEKTVITSDEKTPAKLSDIKPGDIVAGSRLKTGDGQYELVKITKFGPKPAKAAATTGGSDHTGNGVIKRK